VQDESRHACRAHIGGRRPKLTKQQIDEAKKKVSSGEMSKTEVARLFGVSPSTIGRVVGVNGGQVK
jgi:DNA invertase Pin-like site-specific DNA recombinase